MIKRNLVYNILLLLSSIAISLFIFFVVGETYFRISFKASNAGPPNNWFVFHEQRGSALLPGDYAYVDIAAFRDVEVNINEFGLRHSMLSLEIPDNQRRITVLGDSFVFGAALDATETITAQIQARAGQEYEVVPVAVPGYGTGEQILFLKELIDQGYEIGDHLVFVFFTNDILDNVGLTYGTMERRASKPVFSVSEDGQLQHSRPVAPNQNRQRKRTGQPNRLNSQSLFLRYLIYQVEVLAATSPAIVALSDSLGLAPRIHRRPGIVGAWYDDGWEERWKVSERLLEWLAINYGGNDEFRLTFAFIPSPFQVMPAFREMLSRQQKDDPKVSEFLSDIERPQRHLREASEQFGIEFIDTSDAIMNWQKNYPVYFAREGHLNEYGAAIVGDAVYEGLFRENQDE